MSIVQCPMGGATLAFAIADQGNGVYEVGVLGRLVDPPKPLESQTDFDMSNPVLADALRAAVGQSGFSGCQHDQWSGMIRAVSENIGAACVTCGLAGSRCPARMP